MSEALVAGWKTWMAWLPAASATVALDSSSRWQVSSRYTTGSSSAFGVHPMAGAMSQAIVLSIAAL